MENKLPKSWWLETTPVTYFHESLCGLGTVGQSFCSMWSHLEAELGWIVKERSLLQLVAGAGYLAASLAELLAWFSKGLLHVVWVLKGVLRRV